MLISRCHGVLCQIKVCHGEPRRTMTVESCIEVSSGLYFQYLSEMKNHAYYVYILLCTDGSYYTGVTSDLEKRVDEHNSGLIPTCYTFSRRPLTLKFVEVYQFVNDAIGREKQIKRWSRAKKVVLIDGNVEELERLSMNGTKRRSSMD